MIFSKKKDSRVNFTFPKDKNELVAKFLSQSKEEQKPYLLTILLAVEQTGDQGLLRLVNVLRTDPRTQEIVTGLEDGFRAEAAELQAKQ